MLKTTSQPAWCHNPEDHYIYIYIYEHTVRYGTYSYHY
jgi:hypothetical protein